MRDLLNKYDLENMINVINDRINDFEEYCDVEEYGTDYRKGLYDTVELLESLIPYEE